MSLEPALANLVTEARRADEDLAELKGRQTRLEVQWLQVQGELREGQRRIEARLGELVDLLKQRNGVGHG